MKRTKPKRGPWAGLLAAGKAMRAREQVRRRAEQASTTTTSTTTRTPTNAS